MNTIVSRETLDCCGCRSEPRLPNQRYGKNCRNQAMKKHRARIREKLLRLEALEACFTQNTPLPQG